MWMNLKLNLLLVLRSEKIWSRGANLSSPFAVNVILNFSNVSL